MLQNISSPRVTPLSKTPKSHVYDTQHDKSNDHNVANRGVIRTQLRMTPQSPKPGPQALGLAIVSRALDTGFENYFLQISTLKKSYWFIFAVNQGTRGKSTAEEWSSWDVAFNAPWRHQVKHRAVDSAPRRSCADFEEEEEAEEDEEYEAGNGSDMILPSCTGTGLQCHTSSFICTRIPPKYLQFEVLVVVDSATQYSFQHAWRNCLARIGPSCCYVHAFEDCARFRVLAWVHVDLGPCWLLDLGGQLQCTQAWLLVQVA